MRFKRCKSETPALSYNHSLDGVSLHRNQRVPFKVSLYTCGRMPVDSSTCNLLGSCRVCLQTPMATEAGKNHAGITAECPGLRRQFRDEQSPAHRVYMSVCRSRTSNHLGWPYAIVLHYAWTAGARGSLSGAPKHVTHFPYTSRSLNQQLFFTVPLSELIVLGRLSCGASGDVYPPCIP